MRAIIAYLITVLALVFGLWVQKTIGNIPEWLAPFSLQIDCILVATMTGCLYCLRAVYIHRSAKNDWDSRWQTWYYLRPITSGISGLVAFIFLKAGLLALDAQQQSASGDFGYIALAAIAGLNVDNFVRRIEEIARAAFGIDASQASKDKKQNEQQEEQEDEPKEGGQVA